MLNELLDAKLSISRIKSEVLNLAGELLANEAAERGDAIKRLLEVVEFIENSDVNTKDIKL
ncbi:hypothetical protein COJ85_32985 [Bacillus sp. AFS076308]|uniref:hypothetical protein n=1 Tax=unclassified Bacillus (in: firmicutes) TaxID=185979 RepID=UPI000BF3E878|nr:MULTISPECIES: hypothetical protein [unclassified Bacillus (in: firmicutes)]PFN76201.1 hypothetical protein COJ85_32985 [Bacillus sp. AFS076308]PGV48334.1 hypothetical protein COD92_26845 [Bacillus sp. AFS037270]